MYDKVRATNFVLRTINNFIARNSPDLKATGSITVVSGQATLPSDFHSMISIYNGSSELLPKHDDEDLTDYNYEIIGSVVYTDALGPLTVNYKKALGTLTTAGSAPTGDFPLPVFYVELCKKYAKMFLNAGSQADAMFMSQIESDVRKIASTKDRGRLERRGLWGV